jgi:hypothetical protein
MPKFICTYIYVSDTFITIKITESDVTTTPETNVAFVCFSIQHLHIKPLLYLNYEIIQNK